MLLQHLLRTAFDGMGDGVHALDDTNVCKISMSRVPWTISDWSGDSRFGISSCRPSTRVWMPIIRPN